ETYRSSRHNEMAWTAFTACRDPLSCDRLLTVRMCMRSGTSIMRSSYSPGTVAPEDCSLWKHSRMEYPASTALTVRLASPSLLMGGMYMLPDTVRKRSRYSLGTRPVHCTSCVRSGTETTA